MTQNSYPREIKFESISNFRDLGGYRARDGREVTWRRVFRSANLGDMTANDLDRMSDEFGLHLVLDLRSKSEVEKQGTGLLSGSKIAYHNISLGSDGREGPPNDQAFQGLKNMGEFYFTMARHDGFGERLVEALKVVAEPDNHPLVFHCFAGKDRTGILAAFLLNVLNVADEDINKDYSFSLAYMDVLKNRIKKDTQTDKEPIKIPDYFWDASSELMGFFLAAIRREYGSPREYLRMHGAELSLFERLEKLLLVQ
jgi:protein-tyrosine phosphatase